jgi:Baseplate J-like protein
MTATPPSSIPVSVDYTSKDYYSLRSDLIARIQNRVPNWTGTDNHDFGIAMVEAFAYLGDLMSYYIDRAANESYINTATQRSSVINIAQTYGYTIAGYSAAYADLTFTNSSADDVTIPAGTVVSGDLIIGDTVKTVDFTTAAEVTVVANLTQTVTGYQGRSVLQISNNATADGELIGTSTGLPNMAFELGETPVVAGSISIYVQEGDVFSKWQEVRHITDYGPTDLVFTTYTDENDNVFINFGDGVSGVIPTLYSEIRARYTVGGGAIGNVPTGTLTNIVYVPALTDLQVSALQSVITVTNTTVGLGGADPESTDQIRSLAPLSLRANYRAVTLQDYADLSFQAAVKGSSVAKASATGTWPSVTLYLAPSRTATDTDPAPGLDGTGVTINGNPTNEFTTLAADISAYLADKVLMGTTVTVQPPTYVDAIITVQYTKQTQYTDTEIQTGIKSKIVTQFGYNNMYFQQTIAPQNIEYQLAKVPGILNAKVTSLHRQGGSGLNTLVGSAGEIFRFLESNLSIGSA